MDGWISLHRKFIGWEWYDDLKMVKLFIHLLIRANHAEGTWQGIKINRGQLITGLDKLEKETKISKQSLRTCLKRLEKTKEINTQVTNKYRIITLCNYDSYQDNQQATNKQTNKQLTSNQQATNKQLTANNNDNKKNNNNNDNKQTIPNFEEFKNYALEKEPSINISSLKLKYEAWKENDWKNGNDKKIKNWKSSLLNTIQYLEKSKPNNGKQLINDIWKK